MKTLEATSYRMRAEVARSTILFDTESMSQQVKVMIIDLVRGQQQKIVEVCRRFGVARLEIFGSSTTGDFDPHRSDLDFLVALRPHATLSRFEQYFGLREALQALFGRPIDLVMVDALRNPYFIDSVNETRQLLYAA